MEGTLVALAERNRLHIVELLRARPRSVNELVDELGLTQPLVSKHLRVLRQAGLVRAAVHGQQRVYRLEPAPFRELETWVESFRRAWEGRLDSLDEYLQEAQRHRQQGKK